MRRHAEQTRALADLIGETLAVVQAHDAVGARHVLVLLAVAGAIGLQVLPARGDVGHRLQRAGRNRRIARVRLAEIAGVELAVDARQRFFQAQALGQRRILRRGVRAFGGVRVDDETAGERQRQRQARQRLGRQDAAAKRARQRPPARAPGNGIFIHVFYPREN
ncbi:hypothetical protein FE772_22905 [Lysobacter enzymogenes]|nr:hypothetical protein [Lysobacter enzymogenes]QCW28067.1 hypothetical protein FE772_22905 [Lysobacter enzymogenes]